jgi:hypothetical protein
MNKRIIILIVFFTVSLSFAPAGGKPYQANHKEAKKTDTVFANQLFSNTRLLMDTHHQYTMLIYATHSYKSIKLLDRQVEVKGNRVTIVQKLYDGITVNTDSVIVDKQTLMPVESYSDISTSKDSFIYKGNRISGAMMAAVNQKRSITKIDTSFSGPMFNGLAYIETYQALNYEKNRPFFLAQYVPGHSVNFERVEYVKDEEMTVDGIPLPAIVLEIKKTHTITIHCWLSKKTRELLKIEGAFPGFSYYLLRL